MVTKKQKNKEKKEKRSRRPKKVYTYAEAHNRAFWAFNKASRVMIWGAVLNVVGLMVAIIQATFFSEKEPIKFLLDSYFYSTIVSSKYNYPLCFASSSLISRFLEFPPKGVVGGMFLDDYVFIIINVAITIVLSALVVFISVKASAGKKWALYTQCIFYILDTAVILVLYLLGEYGSNIWIMFGIHVIILFFLGTSIYQYYKILTIEKVYKNSITNTNGETIQNQNSQMMMANPKSAKKSKEQKGDQNNGKRIKQK